MARPKGGSNRSWSKDEKLKYVLMVLNDEMSSRDIEKEYGIYHSMITNWVQIYCEMGEDGLENKRKPGNPLAKYINKKKLTKDEEKDFELMRLRIENERLKKGYTEADASLAKRKSLEKNSR